MEEEKKIIDERLEAYCKNPEAGYPWEEVYKRIVTKRGNSSPVSHDISPRTFQFSRCMAICQSFVHRLIVQ